MAVNRNFLLGYGERLTKRVDYISSPSEKQNPYGFEESRDHLAPQFRLISNDFRQLPDEACPNDESVAVFTLHPEFLAKSFYPNRLFSITGLSSIGSKPTRIKPRKVTRDRIPTIAPTTNLLVAGKRTKFTELEKNIHSWNASRPGEKQIMQIESVASYSVAEKTKFINLKSNCEIFEVALHTPFRNGSEDVLGAFEYYASTLGLSPDFDRRFNSGGLCFLPLEANAALVQKLAQFTFLRVAREMPTLRPLNPMMRSSVVVQNFKGLPDADPLDRSLRVAIFDGGLPKESSLSKWVNSIELDDIRNPDVRGLIHGHDVTSALLFGSLEDKDRSPNAPYSNVDHIRIIDTSSGDDPYELYDVLKRVRDTLQSSNYEYVNLSVAPAIPVEDDEVHAWTAVLDSLCSDGKRLISIAAGNGGMQDKELGFNRVQTPADCVNCMAVGAADSRSNNWNRAEYSSVGPGRRPGIVKPDVLAFGGTESEKFLTVDPYNQHALTSTYGTSFASPLALRMALGIRAHFGGILNPLVAKALLIHSTDSGNLERVDVGWGRIPEEIDSYVLCKSGEVRVVYQGELTSGQVLRAQVPFPNDGVQGKVNIKSTFCFATETDPEDPGNYTRAGLTVTLRPHDSKFSVDKKTGKQSTYPKTRSFFSLKNLYPSENELRRDAHKWETTLHHQESMLASSLKQPVFDIHYAAREGGAKIDNTVKIPYALVVTVTSKRTPDLYDKIVRQYRNQLQPLMPVVDIPLTV